MKKFISKLIQSCQPIIRLPAQMGNRNNPNAVNRLQINEAEWKPFHLPTARLKFSRFAQIGMRLDFLQRLLDLIEKIISEKFPALLKNARRFPQLFFREPMIGDGFHAMRGGLWSSLRRPEFRRLCPTRFP